MIRETRRVSQGKSKHGQQHVYVCWACSLATREMRHALDASSVVRDTVRVLVGLLVGSVFCEQCTISWTRSISGSCTVSQQADQVGVRRTATAAMHKRIMMGLQQTTVTR